MRIAGLVLLGAALCSGAEPRWRELNRAARAAIQTKDYPKLRETLLALAPLLPGNPTVTYNLACAEARLGKADVALAHLRNLAATGLFFDLAQDEDLASLRTDPEFSALIRKMQQNQAAVSSTEAAFPIAGRDLIPEDIAWDQRRRRFLISSVREKSVRTPQGQEVFRSEWPVLALAIDDARQLLWMSTGWLPHCADCKPQDKDRSALLALDLRTGVLQRRVESPIPGLLGDMTISRKGDLYVTGGLQGAVFRLEQGHTQMERLDDAAEFASPQGSALSSSEKTLYVADYVRGMASIDLSTRQLRWLTPGPGIALTGIDGLRRYHDSFVAVQNGTTPPRIVRFTEDLKRMQVLESGTATLGDPTHGVIVEGTFYFLANAGWESWDGAGQRKANQPPVDSTVRRVRLARKF